MKKEATSWSVTFDQKDTPADKLKKAAHVKPSPAQLAWMEKEFIAFVHYGPNTFTNRQWGNGTEKTSDYHPSNLDVEQWCRVCSAAGMKMMIFTAKHYDGFCQWDTKTTDFSSMHSPAAKDVMKAMKDGCENNGLQLGVYLSPWDMHQRGEGLWPTPEYNDYFLAQLRELLTNYGKVDELWFDGACGDFQIWKAVDAYKVQEWYEMIQKLQPTAVIRLYDPYSFATEEEWENIKAGSNSLFWSGQGVRWVGNENGISRKNEWSTQPVFDREIAQNATWEDLGEEKYYTNAVGAIWYPVEVNTIILNQWFWNETTSKVRGVAELVDIFYHSIGNNGTLLLNVSPNTDGVIGSDQEKRLMQLKAYVDETFRVNLAAHATVTASAEMEGCEACHVLDGDKMTYWTMDKEWDLDSDSAVLTFDLGENKRFDQVLVQEYIREGQRVAGWSLEVWQEDRWVEVTSNKTVGYKTIRRFEAVAASRVRLTIQRSWDTPLISGFGLYLSAELPMEEELPEETFAALPATVDENSLQPGLQFSSYKGGMQSAAMVESMCADHSVKRGVASAVSEGYSGMETDYALCFQGYLLVPEDGAYSFTLKSADGSQFYLGDTLFINNDEPHEKASVARVAELKKGYYPIKVLYTSFRNPGWLRLYWKKAGYKEEEIGGAQFYCEGNR